MSLPTGPYKSAEASGRCAFTLIELILVMVILTAVIAVAAPSLANFFRGRALDSEARRLLALTRHGQSRAVSEGMPMQLWVNGEQRTFGLQIEASYNTNDPKSVDFTLDKNMQVEAVTTSTVTAANLRLRRSLGNLASLPPMALAHPGLPTIRFLPDGSIGETSPQSLRLSDRDGQSIWLVLSRNRLNYEIRNQTN